MRCIIFCALACIIGIHIPTLLAQSATRNDVSLYIYNRGNSSIPHYVNLGGVLSECLFDTTKRIKFITHGWTSNSRTPLILNMKDAFLNKDDVTVIMVDWEVPASAQYTVAVSNVPLVGKILGDFIMDMSRICNYSLSNIELIGHSLGAHVSGLAGSRTNGTVGSITGLDPAGPGFPYIYPDRRLSKDDAKLVQVLHTSLIGTLEQIGHCDFYPSGGITQPACDILNITCSHLLANDYKTESINSNNFIGTKCDSYEIFVIGICDDGDKEIMGGIDPKCMVEGRYYLNVNSVSPYAQG